MKRLIIVMTAMLFFWAILAKAQSTSWIGGSSDNWRTASNWTNGVPDAAKDVIIGEANFTGPNQLLLDAKKGIGECKSLTVGNGAVNTIFTCGDDIEIAGN